MVNILYRISIFLCLVVIITACQASRVNSSASLMFSNGNEVFSNYIWVKFHNVAGMALIVYFHYIRTINASFLSDDIYRLHLMMIRKYENDSNKMCFKLLMAVTNRRISILYFTCGMTKICQYHMVVIFARIVIYC